MALFTIYSMRRLSKYVTDCTFRSYRRNIYSCDRDIHSDIEKVHCDRDGDAGRCDVTVRLARREDMPLVHQMIKELAEYEGMPGGPQLSPAAWFFGLIAEWRGAPAGHLLVNRAYSSWTRRAYYVEDLYVRPDARAAGVGAALVRHFCQMAVAEGITRIDWHVLESNASAQRLYARLGARDMRKSEGRAALRLDAHRIAAVAKGELLPSPDQRKSDSL